MKCRFSKWAGGPSKTAVCCVFLAALLLPAASPAAQTVPSEITAVVLFTRQALVERQARCEVGAGLNELHVATDAFAVDKDSINARIDGAGEIVSVQLQSRPLTDFPQQQVKRLETELRQQRQARQALKNRRAVMQKKIIFLDSLVDFSKTQLPKDVQTRFPDIQSVRETLAFLNTAYNAIHQELQELDSQMEAIGRKIRQLEQELAAVRGSEAKVVHIIEIFFNAHRDQTIGLTVQYLAQNAAWTPLYRAAVPSGLSGIDLSMFAEITQKTGENWSGVDLSVSNVTPMRGGRLPQPSSWILDIPRPMPKRTLEMAPLTAPMAAAPADEARTAGVKAEIADFAQAERSERPLSFEYRMPFPVDIDAQEKTAVLPLFTRHLAADFFHFSLPEQSPRTFLVADVKADSELLSGPMNVYLDGRYVGKTTLSEKKAGEPFRLNLGADRRVRVKREKIVDRIRETFFGKIQRATTVREMGYKISAENMQSNPVNIRIVDSLPVSRTDRIEVKDVRLDPEPSRRDVNEQEGVVAWDIEVAPGGEAVIRIDFVLTYPADTPPLGL